MLILVVERDTKKYRLEGNFHNNLKQEKNQIHEK